MTEVPSDDSVKFKEQKRVVLIDELQEIKAQINQRFLRGSTNQEETGHQSKSNSFRRQGGS